MTGSLTLIGHDGGPLQPPAARALMIATLVVGARRHLDAVDVPPHARTVAMGSVDRAIEALRGHDGPAVVLASGDPGFFGILRRLRQHFSDVTVHPAVSSVALAFARASLPWDDAAVVSAHGRDARHALAVVRSGVVCAVLTDERTGPQEVAAAASPDARVVVCERLGATDERVVDASAEHVARCETTWRQPNFVVVAPGPTPPRPQAVHVAGHGRPTRWALPDDAFDHRDGMVTKAEIRAWALAQIAPRPGQTVWDVGAGSGSVAVECARLGAACVAVERDPDQCARIRSNAARHGVRIDVVHGAAPDVLAGIPAPDAVFVGGGGRAVVDAVAALRPDVAVVPLVALDRVSPAVESLRRAGFEVSGVQLAVSRLADLPGGSLRLAAVNPVVVLTGRQP